ncbi:biotin/lipoyl-containing protein [Nocardia stercoris]|uniref:biotin/lipoyl-containing protein n=1 Tax=Nocardia stercoris TaxID=2483361 RepID=UPI0018F63DEB|nr:biotin/lipoyl-containing protein [Nocardia stercoris]
MTEFRMPSLCADMTDGTLLHWFVSPGDQVQHGDLVAKVYTVETAIEVERLAEGVPGELLVLEGPPASVGTVLALIDSAGFAAETAVAPDSP